MVIISEHIDTPIGKMTACTTDEGVCVFDFSFRRMMPTIFARVSRAFGTSIEQGTHPHITTLRNQVNEYFTGERKEFDVPIHLLGSPFQIKVWKGLQQIAYGETRSYRGQSLFLGDKKAIRAVARANGENSLAIIIPCHRVIGERGILVGYSGGLEAKQWLLDHERKYAGSAVQQRLF